MYLTCPEELVRHWEGCQGTPFSLGYQHAVICFQPHARIIYYSAELVLLRIATGIPPVAIYRWLSLLHYPSVGLTVRVQVYSLLETDISTLLVIRLRLYY